MSKLTMRKVNTVKIAGMYGDGDGLYLSVKPSGSKSWVLRTMVTGRRRDIGIGSTSLVTLAEAREKARELRTVARSGGDPLADRNKRVLTFQEAAEEYHRIIAPSFSSRKHERLWLSALRIHAYPRLAHLPLAGIDVSDVRKVLEPIWTSKHETARRVKQRIEAIFDWAKAEGHHSTENPCMGIKRVLKPQRRNPTHHAALPWQEMPAFYAALKGRESTAARTLQFIILTASRSKEVREANWSEVNGSTWTIPAERAKTRRPHRIPLTEEGLGILEQVSGFDSVLIFPSIQYRGPRGSRSLSVNAFRALYARMGQTGLTTHGFRSTFRDWCSESAKASREVAEAALAHSLGEVERAYRRSDLYDRRRELMVEWSRFVTSG